jgi:hypothetical protein
MVRFIRSAWLVRGVIGLGQPVLDAVGDADAVEDV